MTTLLALIAVQQTPTIEEFFPIVVGEKRRYKSEGDGVSYTSVEEILAPIGMGEKGDQGEATPVRFLINGREAGKTYYRIQDNTLFMIGTNPAKPFDSPRPILKIGKGKVLWDWSGQEGGERVEVKFESEFKGKKKVLGEDREILTLKANAVVSPGGLEMKVNQTVIYARGVGMVEMIEERKTKKTSAKRKTTLESYERVEDGMH